MGLQIGNGITVDGSVEIVFIDPEAPTNLIPPVITGNFTAGSTVTVSNGDWAGVPNIFTFAYEWQLDSITVPGATSNTFLLTDSMAGEYVSATVTATNVVGSGSANSPSYLISAWGPGQWTVTNTFVNGSELFDSTTNYVWRSIGGTAILSRSNNGNTWSNITTPITTITGILQANNRVIIWKSGSNASAYTTNDGTTWINSNIAVNTTTNLKSGAFDGANIIILRGDPASNSFVRSTDLGSSWANVDTGSLTNFKRDIAYGNGVFLTVGDFYQSSPPPFINTSLISIDGGETWANSTPIKATSIAYGAGKFVATYPYGAPSNPSYAFVSTNNGNSWTQTLLPDQGWSSVVFADNHFVASEAGGNIIYSEDGITWSSPYRTIPAIQAGSGTMSFLASQSLLFNGGTGLFISHAQFPGPTTDPTQPSNVNASSLNSTEASLTWTAPLSPGTSPILYYQVDAIGTNGAANLTQNTPSTATSYTFTGLDTGKDYYFNVAAVNSSGVGLFTSSEQTIQILPAIGETFGGGKVVEAGLFFAIVCSSIAGTTNGSWSTASSFCSSFSESGYTDWQMPSLVQMDAVNTNRSVIGGFTAGIYWTTTAYSPAQPTFYWTVNMPTGAHVPYDASAYVRAIRLQTY